MKKYIKPATEIEIAYSADLFMITATANGETIPGGGPGGGGGDAKDRDDFEDEEFLLMMQEQENPNKTLW